MLSTSFLADLSASIDTGTDFARLEIGPELCRLCPVDNSNSFWIPSSSSTSFSLS